MLQVVMPASKFCELEFQALAGNEEWEWVEHLRLTATGKASFGKVFGSPLLQTLGSFEFGAWSLAGCMPEFLKAFDSAFPRCDTLDIAHGEMEDGFSELLRWHQFGSLKELRLRRNHLRTEHIRAWAASDIQPTLTSLDLHDNLITPDGLAELVALPSLAGLRHLDISDNLTLDRRTCATMAAAPYREQLRSLKIGNGWTQGQDETLRVALRELFGQVSWPKLEELDLGEWIDSSEGESLASYLHPSRLPRLKTLGFQASSLGEKGTRTLAETGLLRQLRHLAIRKPYQTGVMRALAGSADAGTLLSLTFEYHLPELARGSGGAEVWDQFLEGGIFRDLRLLKIGNTRQFGPAHGRALVESGHFPKLEAVSAGKMVPKEAVKILKKRFNFWAEGR